MASSDLAISGLATGFDWSTLVDKLTDIERVPQRLLLTQQTALQNRNAAYGSLATELGVLKNKADALNDATLFNGRQVSVASSTVATATAAANTPLGVAAFNFTQLATAAVHNGATNAGTPLNGTNDVSALVLSNAAFATPVTAGTFTVNGKQVTIATTDTLQQVFDKINTATGNVTGSYDNSTDKITLNSASPIVLGSATDTSNFLQVAFLNNNGTGTIASTNQLGAIKVNATLATANFATAVTGGSTGQFKINGVTINFDTAVDTPAAVLQRINDSAAGVSASYDSITDKFSLTNRTTGDMGIALEDVTGNFLAATQLATGTLTRGKNLTYTVNGGSALTSASNTVTNAGGITGLTVTALTTGATNVTIGSDTTKIKTAITDLVTQYNKVQSLIDTDTASSTDEKGKVKAGILAGDRDIANLAATLRSKVFSSVSGLTGSISKLAQLGYQTNGNDNNLTLADSAALDSALASKLTDVRDFFTNSTTGFATALSAYIDKQSNEDDGALVTHQNLLTQQSTDIDTQVTAMERIVQTTRQRLIDSFQAMERAQAQITQQQTYLTKTFGS